jgi:hypothetical protein
MAKFPHSNEIAWGKIKEVRVSSGEGNYSFEFDLPGKDQKMTISITPGKTSYTLSKEDGSPLLHATQDGKEVRIFDFSAKLAKIPPKKARAAKPARKK